jgi:hypothetical protein
MRKYFIFYRLKDSKYLELGCSHPVACIRSGSGSGFPSNATLFEKLFSILFNNHYMFRSYDHLQTEIYFRLKMVIRPKHVAVIE